MKTKLSFFDKLMVNVTFAEANAAEEVMEIRSKCKTDRTGQPLLDKKDAANTLPHGMAPTEANA